MLDAKRIYSLTFIIVLLTSATLPIIPMVFAQTSISVSPGTGTSLSVVTVSVSNYLGPEAARRWKIDPLNTWQIPVSLAKLDDKGKITHEYGLLGVWDEVNDKAYRWTPDSETVWSKKCRIPLQAIPGYKSPGIYFIVLGGDIGTEPIAKASFTVPQLEPLEDIIEDPDLNVKVELDYDKNSPFTLNVNAYGNGALLKSTNLKLKIDITGDLVTAYGCLTRENAYEDVQSYLHLGWGLVNQWEIKDPSIHIENTFTTDENGRIKLDLFKLEKADIYENGKQATREISVPGSAWISQTGPIGGTVEIIPRLFAEIMYESMRVKVNSLTAAILDGTYYRYKQTTGQGVSGSITVMIEDTPGRSFVSSEADTMGITYDHVAKITNVEMSNNYQVNDRITPYISPDGNKYRKRDAVSSSPANKLLPNDVITITKYVQQINIDWIYPQPKKYLNILKPSDAIENIEASMIIQPSPGIQLKDFNFDTAKWGTVYATVPGIVLSGVSNFIVYGIYGTSGGGPVVGLVAGAIGFVVGVVWSSVSDFKDSSEMDFKFVRIEGCQVIIDTGELFEIKVLEGSAELYDYNYTYEKTIEEGYSISVDKDENIQGPKQVDQSSVDDIIINLFNQAETDSISTVDHSANGLVAYYPFNGDYKDYSGEDNHGSLEGTTSFASGEIGESVYFDGESWINIPDSDSLDLSSSLTFSLWVNKQDAGTRGWSVLFSKADSTALDDSSPYAFAHSIDGLHPLIRLTQNNGYTVITSNSWTGFNEWHMLTVTWDGKDIKFYNNGEYQDTRVWEGVLPDSDSPLEIGRDQPGSVEYYRGWMDDLRIYNHALSASQVMELYNKQEITPTSSVVVRDDEEQTRDHDTNDEDPSDSTPLDDVLVYVRDYSKTSGSTVSIPVFIENAHNIGNMDFIITYDRSVLNAVGYEKGSLTEGSMVEANILDDEVFVAFTDSDGLNGDGTLIYIKYDVVGDGGERCEVVPKVSTANMAETFDLITVIDSAGMFVVEGLKGDANGDGRITAVDALMALQMAVNRIPEDDICDMNGDGSVSSLDAVLIREKALKG